MQEEKRFEGIIYQWAPMKTSPRRYYMRLEKDEMLSKQPLTKEVMKFKGVNLINLRNISHFCDTYRGPKNKFYQSLKKSLEDSCKI